jgi:hypothetical protein
VKHSILNPAQFAEENGACWVPMDGAELPADCALRQLTGMTKLPDAGGLFVRGQEYSGGQDNDPDRTPASDIAKVQNDALGGHSHTLGSSGTHTHGAFEYIYFGGNVPSWVSVAWAQDAKNSDNLLRELYSSVQPAGNHNHDVSSAGGVETRVKNLNFWIYICIN